MNWNEVLDRPFFLRLSLSLLHFLWQGAAAAAVFAVGDALLRRRRAGPRTHYGLACATLAVMAILPLATFARARAFRVPASSDSRAAGATASPASFAPAGATAAPGLRPASSQLSELARRLADGAAGARPALVGLWMMGVALLSIRLLAGWRIAGRFATRATAPARAELSAAFDLLARRLHVVRPVRLLESAAIHVPSALGFLRPVVLVPVSALTGLDPEQLQALLAHELAHVRRHDYLVNLLQSAVETLLFYHPAVWWVSGRVRRERENCCDDLAVAVTGDARAYAGALVRLEERRGAGQRENAALVVAANGGDLFRRIARILRPGEPGLEAPSPRVAGAVALSALLFVGAAARVSTLEASTAHAFSRVADSGVFPAADGSGSAAGKTAGATPASTVSTASPASTVSPASPASSASSGAPPALLPTGGRAGTTAVTPITPDAGQNRAVRSDEDAPAEAVNEATLAGEPAGYPGRLTTDELRAFRIHGVTPEFRGEIAAAGYPHASPDDLVALRIHGVSAADIAGIQKRFGRVSLERCIEFAIHGVSPAWLAEMAGAGLTRFSPDQAVAMRIHGVTPEFFRQIHEAGYRDASVDDAVSLRIHGVRLEDSRLWESLGMSRPGLDQLVSARIQGVEPAFARAMRAEGFSDLDMDQLTSFRIHGVTPEFVREIKAAGLSPISADDAVALRIHGVTPSFLTELRSLGLAVGSADDATALRIHGVLSQDLRALRTLGYQAVTADDLVALRIHGISADDIRRSNRESGTRLSIDDLVDARVEARRFR